MHRLNRTLIVLNRTLIVMVTTLLLTGCGREGPSEPSGKGRTRIDLPKQLIAYDLVAEAVAEDGSVRAELRKSQPFVVRGRFISPKTIDEKVRVTIIQPRGEAKAATVGRNIAEITEDGRHRYRYECRIKGVRHLGVLVARVTVGTKLVDEATLTIVK